MVVKRAVTHDSGDVIGAGSAYPEVLDFSGLLLHGRRARRNRSDTASHVSGLEAFRNFCSADARRPIPLRGISTNAEPKNLEWRLKLQLKNFPNSLFVRPLP